jgi:DNA-directed RNA polymerase specialized sigma subunit
VTVGLDPLRVFVETHQDRVIRYLSRILPSTEAAEAILAADTEFTDRLVCDVDLTRALGDLPIRQRQALTLRFLGELTVGEAAAIMGVSPSGVKKATAAGVKALRQSPHLLEYTRLEYTRMEVSE